MATFKIYYYDSDGAGVRDVLTKTEFFEGTYTEAKEHIKTVKSPWGGTYVFNHLDNWNKHQTAKILLLPTKVKYLEHAVKVIQEELIKIYGEFIDESIYKKLGL